MVSQLHTVTSHEDLNSGREMAEIVDTKQVSVVSLCQSQIFVNI